MELNVDLPPFVEARLHDRARLVGLSVPDYVKQVLTGAVVEPQSLPSVDERIAAFEGLLASHADDRSPVIPMDALRREHLYEDRR